MSADLNNPQKLAFSTRCVPGSEAEIKEQERLAEFQRCKTLRKAQEELDKPERDAQRNQEYLAASEANRAQIQREKAARNARSGFLVR